MKNNPRVSGRPFTPKQYGQLKQFRNAVGDLAQPMIEWMLRPDNWWKFSQQVRAETKQYLVPDHPDLRFLVKHRNRALRIMRNELRSSTAPSDVQFCATIDQRSMQQWQSFLLVYAAGKEELIARIEAAKSVEDIQLLFIEIVDERN